MLDFLIALVYLAADYHSGQFSKGYKLGCQAHAYALREFGVNISLNIGLSPQQQKLYFKLAEKYQNRL